MELVFRRIERTSDIDVAQPVVQRAEGAVSVQKMRRRRVVRVKPVRLDAR